MSNAYEGDNLSRSAPPRRGALRTQSHPAGRRSSIYDAALQPVTWVGEPQRFASKRQSLRARGSSVHLAAYPCYTGGDGG